MEFRVSMKGFPCGSAGKESTCNAEDLGSILGWGRSPGEGKGYPLQYSGLENSMDCIAHGVAKSQTWLSNFHFTTYTQTHKRIRSIILWAGNVSRVIKTQSLEWVGRRQRRRGPLASPLICYYLFNQSVTTEHRLCARYRSNSRADKIPVSLESRSYWERQQWASKQTSKKMISD